MLLLVTVAAALGGGALGVVGTARGARHCREPADGAGRAVLHRMNESHAAVTAWGLGHVEVGRDFTILDVGCGGGRTIQTLAAMAADGRVFGIDYSQESVAVARETNRDELERGRVDVRQGTVSHLPYPNATFDLVTAVETHYYWPDLPNDLGEVMRVLKPGGTFLLVAETYRGRRNDWMYAPVMRLLLRAAYLDPEEHRRLLADAGFREVEVFVDPARGWICARGRR